MIFWFLYVHKNAPFGTAGEAVNGFTPTEMAEMFIFTKDGMTAWVNPETKVLYSVLAHEPDKHAFILQ